jgi:hypothetical protein
MSDATIMAIIDDFTQRLKDAGATEFVMAVGGDGTTGFQFFGNYKQCGFLALQAMWEVMQWQMQNSVTSSDMDGPR